MKKIDVKAIKIKNGFFIYFKDIDYYIDKIKINDELLEKTHTNDYGYTKATTIKSIKKIVKPVLREGFFIIDKFLVSNKVPEFIDFEDEEKYDSHTLQKLYNRRTEYAEPTLKEVEFNLIIEAEFPNFTYKLFKFSTGFTRKFYDGKITEDFITSKDLKSQKIDTIAFPSSFSPMLPCCLPKENLYQIIRQHVRENIDTKVAKITSDYDFCFSVAKIHNSYKPKYSAIYKKPVKLNAIAVVKQKQMYETCLHIAPTPRTDYAVLKDLYANNHTEMNTKVKTLLSNIITNINTPLEICPHCEGTGLNNAIIETIDINSLVICEN